MRKIVILSTILGTMLLGVAPKNKIENEIKSVRSILGDFNPIEHTTLQIRTGYINLNTNSQIDSSAFAIGGHAHFDTKRWNGIRLGTVFYTVQGLGLQEDNPLKLNSDFFDIDGDSFSMIAEAHIDGKWGESKVKLGRQILNSPHADSDDIRMMPNYFNAYRIRNTDIEDLTIHAGLINKMAGWENGVDSSKFVNISEVLGADESTDGVYFVAGIYEGIENLSLSLWNYYYDEIATIWYAELGYSHVISDDISLSFGLQYDTSTASGKELLGEQSSNTFGSSMEVEFSNLGITALLAYNYEDETSGSSSLSLGGGTFFTSMEDQTIDAMEAKGSAWIIGLVYDFSNIEVEGLVFGIAYGQFIADDDSIYDTTEIDAVAEYTINDKFSITLAYATIDDRTQTNEDYNQVRVVANYNF